MKRFLAAGSFLIAVVAASAQLVPVDFKTKGDGLLTRDLSSGLEWLNLNQTMGTSADQVATQFGAGGLWQGFRFATTTEFTQLVTDFGLPISNTYMTIFSYDDSTLQKAAHFQDMLGHAGPWPFAPPWTISWGALAEAPGAMHPVPPGYMRRGSVDIFLGSPQDGPPYTYATTNIGIPSGSPSTSTGAYLVRPYELTPVPEPAAFALAGGVALMAAIGVRRLRQRRLS